MGTDAGIRVVRWKDLGFGDTVERDINRGLNKLSAGVVGHNVQCASAFPRLGNERSNLFWLTIFFDIQTASVLLFSWLERCPPKAEVTSSNLVGRANQINDLSKSFKSARTPNSPQTHRRNVGIGLSSVATGCHPEWRA